MGYYGRPGVLLLGAVQGRREVDQEPRLFDVVGSIILGGSFYVLNVFRFLETLHSSFCLHILYSYVVTSGGNSQAVSVLVW